MASVRLPGVTTDTAGLVIKRALEDARIEVPIVGFPVRGARPAADGPPAMVLVRVSTPRYVEPSDIDRLVTSLSAQIGSIGRSAAAE
jgi:hypothetical protein